MPSAMHICASGCKYAIISPPQLRTESMYAPTDYISCAPTYSFTSCTVVLTPALQSIQPQLVADPEFYAAHKLFGGHWAPPSGAAPDLESRKDALLNFYVNEVEQRRWYGFWDYGEFLG